MSSWLVGIAQKPTQVTIVFLVLQGKGPIKCNHGSLANQSTCRCDSTAQAIGYSQNMNRSIQDVVLMPQGKKHFFLQFRFIRVKRASEINIDLKKESLPPIDHEIWQQWMKQSVFSRMTSSNAATLLDFGRPLRSCKARGRQRTILSTMARVLDVPCQQNQDCKVYICPGTPTWKKK